MTHDTRKTHDHAFFAAQNCPNPVTWTNDIQNFFTETDIQHMAMQGRPIHLDSYTDVKVHANQIYSAVSSGYMPQPPEQPWTVTHPDWITTFACWIKQGCQK
jgi:uncharacterized lipoprotein YajG